MKLKNVFLTISLVFFAIGLSQGGESIFWYMGLPTGAVFFGLFMIFMLLEKETALLDEQNRKSVSKIEQSLDNKSSATSDQGNCATKLTTAHSH